MIVLPAFIAAFAAFINVIYLASHPDSFVSEMVAFTVLGACSSSVVKPATRVAIGYISSLTSGYPSTLNLPSLVADSLSYRLTPNVRTVSRPIGWASAAPVFFDRDARIRAGWDVYGLSRLSAIPPSRLLFPSRSYFLRQESFLSGRHLVYDWVDRTYGEKYSQPQEASELTLLFGRCSNSFGQLNLALPPSRDDSERFSNMGWPRITRIPARPGGHSGVQFGLIMEVRATVAVLTCALLVYQLWIQSRSEYPTPYEISDLLQLELPDLLPGHTHGVSVAHEEPVVLVPSESQSGPSGTSETRETPPIVLSGRTTSASSLVLSQARGRLLLLQISEECDQDKIRARMLQAKRNSASARSGSSSRALLLLVRRQQSGTMKEYQRHMVAGGQVLNLAIAHMLPSRQLPEFSGVPSLKGYSPGLQTIPESRRKRRERR
ncbi:hypothetical protein RhiJN_06981 [Ceratobasidium sp. AG-Ba]|nr:hypothetical protein RhiJN_06981 [Ceratobasidium sp. AG-Ba]QRW07867.1 hypothetical protein RhiLY_06866 [Ceratobasidium sp. AG-Ba]